VSVSLTEELSPRDILIMEYFRVVEGIPQLGPVEIDTEEWIIRNSINYNLIEPDWEQRMRAGDMRQLILPICVRCGSVISRQQRLERFGRRWFWTLCEDCLISDEDRLKQAFGSHYRNKWVYFSPNGKPAQVGCYWIVRTGTGKEDLQLYYEFRYVYSGKKVPSRYKVKDIVRMTEPER